MGTGLGSRAEEAPQLSIVADHIDPARGGCERHLLGFLEHLATTSTATQLVCRDEGTAIPGSIKRHVLGATGFPKAWREWRFCRRASRVLAREDAPVLAYRPFPSATFYCPCAGIYPQTFAAEALVFSSPLRRYLYRPGNLLNLKRQLLLQLEKEMLTAATGTRVIAHSKLIRSQVLETYALAPDRVTVVYPGIDLDVFRPASSGSEIPDTGGAVSLLFAGNNFWQKGLHCALEAVEASVADGIDVRLRIAGGGMRSSFERLAKRMEILDRLSFLGFVPWRKMATLYQHSAALLHPTFCDPCSLVVMEALASGCPVITTRHAGAAEFIEPSLNGFVVDSPHDTGELVSAIAKIANHDAQRRLRRNAFESGRRFDLKVSLDRLMQVLGLMGS